jgi:alkyldihydroxyacetonephosphate synthase
MLDRGVGVDTLETAASWSRIPSLYASVRYALEESIRTTAPREGAKGVVLCHISHSYGDGASLYFTCIFARALGNELEQWRTIKQAATDAIVASGGTLSHHHGIGEDHLPWMLQEKGGLGIEVLRAVKNTLDPHGILNPGKLIPAVPLGR